MVCTAAGERAGSDAPAAAAGGASCSWTDQVVGDGVSTTLKSGAAKVKDSLCKALGTGGPRRGVGRSAGGAQGMSKGDDAPPAAGGA